MNQLVCFDANDLVRIQRELVLFVLFVGFPFAAGWLAAGWLARGGRQ